MTPSFTHQQAPSGDDMLAIKTNQHVEIEFLYDKGDNATHVYLDGYEFPLTCDTLNGLFVGIGDKIMNLVDLSHEADRAYPKIMKEIAHEGRDASRNARFLSSPGMTGRI